MMFITDFLLMLPMILMITLPIICYTIYKIIDRICNCKESKYANQNKEQKEK